MGDLEMRKYGIVGVDPGQNGAFVFLNCNAEVDLEFFEMPITSEKEIDFDMVLGILEKAPPDAHVFLERAMPMAMGAKHAFNYGRGFAALEIAIRLSKRRVTYVEPMKWSKIIHEGISKDLKPKAKSKIAVERLFPSLCQKIPRSRTGQMHDGVMEALLIAEYGRRVIKG